MRTEGDFIHINEWLLPLSWLYGLGVRFRNQLFEIGLLKQHDYDLPIISVGNITVGGSGKTPHVEHLIRLLKDKVKVAVLSRGYKRKSRGYVLAGDDSTAYDIGDESYQIKKKYNDIYVAVDKKRVNGINRITKDEQTAGTDVILLDDALTKCPTDLKPMEFRVLTKAMNLYPYQSLFFTTIEYGELQPFNATDGKLALNKEHLASKHVLLLTGIASPKQIILDIKPHAKEITPLIFADHHRFKNKDTKKINVTFNAMKGEKIIVTTEKDAARLEGLTGLSEEVKQNLYVLPIKVKFMLHQEEEFNHKITDYVRKNSRNSILAQGENDNKSKDCHHIGNRSRTISFRNNR